MTNSEDGIATWSKDPEVKVAALIVTADRRQFSVGYNGFPAGITDTKERLKGDDRLKLTAHAEFNACMNSTVDFHGGTIYTTKAPCHECAKAIVHPRVGLVRCVQPPPDPGSSWFQSCELAVEMMREKGMTVDFYGAKS